MVQTELKMYVTQEGAGSLTFRINHRNIQTTMQIINFKETVLNFNC